MTFVSSPIRWTAGEVAESTSRLVRVATHSSHISPIHRFGVRGCKHNDCALLHWPLLKRVNNAKFITIQDGSARNTRRFFTDSLPSFLVPPAVFTGLLLTLWTYKSIMTVLFQDKIIYMPYTPPFARSERVEDYTSVCKPVAWQQKTIRSLDGTKLEICIGELQKLDDSDIIVEPHGKEVIICYFHGNGSSLPPRLPLLSGVLKAIHAQSTSPVRYKIVALSYRGYWKSTGRASQAGIERDAQALLRWVTKAHTLGNSELVLWGQSIGAGVASTAAATYLSTPQSQLLPITSLILETPFTSIKSMLLTLYPQRWLPYRYLWPFLWNHWDTEMALRAITHGNQPPHILLVPATRDEVVPPEEADKLENICKELRLPVSRKNVVGALHTNATIRRDGQETVANFVVDRTEGRHLNR